MATDAVRQRQRARSAVDRFAMDETKASFKTTEFWAMVGVIAAILIASLR